MKHRLSLLLVMGALFGLSFRSASPELEKRSLFNDRVEMLVPTAMVPMSEEMLQYKYPSERRPTFVMTNLSGTINLAFNHLQDRLIQKEIGDALAQFEKMFPSLHPGLEWIDSGVKKVKGRRFGVLEMTTQAVDMRIYNLMFFTDLDDRFLLFSFNCPASDQEAWAPTAHKILKSVRVQ